MKPITNHISTQHTATAQAVLTVSSAATLEALNNRSIIAADVLETGRVAALLAIKHTAQVIPHCHPVPIDHAQIIYKIEGLSIFIEASVQTVYKTGVTMEALHGATIAALTIFDMLKRIDGGMVISEIKLLQQKGGRQQYRDQLSKPVHAAVIVCSDSIAAGTHQDFSGKAIIGRLEKYQVLVKDYCVVPDEISLIREKVQTLCDNKINLILVTGGTGLGTRDITPEAIRPMLDMEIPGIAEAARSYGQERMPYSMMSRSFAGLIGATLIVALPGSTRGAEESMDALFPYLLHYFKVLEHPPHD